MTAYLIESVHFENSVRFRIYFKTYQQEQELRAKCKRFYKEVFLTEPYKPIEIYFYENGDEVRIVKSTDNCYSAYYKTKKDLS